MEARFVRHIIHKKKKWHAVYVFVPLLSYIANHEVNKRALFLPFFLTIFNFFTFQRGLMNRKPGGLCCDTKETGIKREKRRKGKMNKIWHKNVTRDRVTKQLTGCCLTKNYWEFYFFNHFRKEYGLLNKLISSGPRITWNLKKNNLNLEIV